MQYCPVRTGFLPFLIRMAFILFDALAAWFSARPLAAGFGGLYLLCAFLGALAGTELLWRAADLLNLGLCVPNLYMLFLRREEIAASLEREGKGRRGARGRG